MKASFLRVPVRLGFVIASTVFLSLASCARYYMLTSRAELSKLPVSRGVNGGSYVAETPWQYRGSHYGSHQFFYYYHTGNQLHRREVSIPRGAVVLRFPEVAFGSTPQWVTLDSGSTRLQFSRHYRRSE